MSPQVINAIALIEDVSTCTWMLQSILTVVHLVQCQHLLWSGNKLTVNNPKLIDHLGIIDSIESFGRIHIPKSVLWIGRIQQLEVNCSLPWQCYNLHPQTDSMVPDDESETLSFISQICLPKRTVLRAFGKTAASVLKLISSVNDMVEVQLAPSDSYFKPIMDTKSHIIAANILNGMFDSFFGSMGVEEEERMSLFKLLLSPNPVAWHGIHVGANSLMGEAVVRTMMPLVIDKDVPISIQSSLYFKRWQILPKVLEKMNE